MNSGVHVGVDLLVHGVVGVHRVVVVAVMRAVVDVHRVVVVMTGVDVAADVATMGVDSGDVTAVGVRRRGLGRSDDHPAAAAGVSGAAGATSAEGAAVPTLATGGIAPAGVDVASLDDRTLVAGDDIATTGVGDTAMAVARIANTAGLDGGTLAGEDVAGVGADVAVTDHVPVTVDVGVVDVAGVASVDDTAVGRGVLVAEGDVTEVQVDTTLLHVVAGLGAQDVGVVVAEDIVVAERVVVAERLRIRSEGGRVLRGERDAVGLGNGLLQAVHRVPAAVDDRGRSHGGRHGLHLRGGDVLDAGVLHGAGGVVDEGLRLNRVAEQVENPVDYVRHFFGPFVCVLWGARRRAVRWSGENGTVLTM